MDSSRHGWKADRVRLEGHENLRTANATKLDQAIARGLSRSPGGRRSESARQHNRQLLVLSGPVEEGRQFDATDRDRSRSAVKYARVVKDLILTQL